MANTMLSRTSRVLTAGLLYKSPSAWLKAPSFSPLLCGPQWLFSACSIFATSSHSSASWVEQWRTHGRKYWEINAKTTQLLGNQLWVEAQSPLWDAEDSVYFLPISWAPKWSFTHTCAFHSLQRDQRPSAQVASNKGQVTGQGWATSKSPGKRA